MYLMTPIRTYILMGTSIKPYVGAINSVLPAFMGLFALRFQKRYPAKVAAEGPFFSVQDGKEETHRTFFHWLTHGHGRRNG